MADKASDPESLQRDIDRTRDELARTIDELVDRVHPKRVAQRRVEIFRENAQHYREVAGAKVGLDGARNRGGVKALPGASTSPGANDGSESHHLGTTTYAIRRDKMPLIAGAGVVIVVTATVVVWRLRRR